MNIIKRSYVLITSGVENLSFLNFKLQFFLFLLHSRAAHMISKISQSCQRTPTLTLEN